MKKLAVAFIGFLLSYGCGYKQEPIPTLNEQLSHDFYCVVRPTWNSGFSIKCKDGAYVILNPQQMPQFYNCGGWKEVLYMDWYYGNLVAHRLKIFNTGYGPLERHPVFYSCEF